MSRANTLKLWDAVRATRAVLEGDGCFECCEVSGATMVLVQLVADGVVTESQLKEAKAKAPAPWDAGIVAGKWESPK